VINQIIFLSSFLFVIGLSALFMKTDNSTKRKGTIIIFISCIINFTAFSNFNSISVEGQVIGMLILIIAALHYFIQKIILVSDD